MGRNLYIRFVAGNKPDLLAGELEELKIIGDLFERNRTRLERLEQVLAPGELRRLHGPQVLARNRALNRSGQGTGGLLDRESDRQRRRGRSMFDGGGQCSINKR